MSAIILSFNFTTRSTRPTRVAQSARAEHALRDSADLAQAPEVPSLRMFLADVARLATRDSLLDPWWDDLTQPPDAPFSAADIGACLLPCSGCGARSCERCRCAPRWFNHRRLTAWRSISTLERAIFATLAELRAGVDEQDLQNRDEPAARIYGANIAEGRK